MKIYHFTLEVASLILSLLATVVSNASAIAGRPLEYVLLQSQQPPSYLHPCHRRHKRFNLCVKTTLQQFLNALVHGSQELQTPPIDPLQVPKMEVIQGSGDVVLDMIFNNVSILGLANTKVVSVRSNLEDNKFEVTLKHPFLHFLGDYSGEGGIKTFPIVGEGDFSFNMTDVSAAWIIYLAESSEGMHKHYVIDNFLIDIIPAEISAKFGNAIDDDDRLGSAFNGFFNENSQEIFKLTKPKITNALSEVFSDFANQVLSRFSPETLLPS